MEALFRDYWWLIFPIWGLGMGSWASFARFRRQRDALALIREYASKGEQPPQALLDMLTGDEGVRRPQAPAQYLSLVGLFGVMAAGFGGVAWYYGFQGVGWPFGIVAVVMAAVAVWALLNALIIRSPRA